MLDRCRRPIQRAVFRGGRLNPQKRIARVSGARERQADVPIQGEMRQLGPSCGGSSPAAAGQSGRGIWNHPLPRHREPSGLSGRNRRRRRSVQRRGTEPAAERRAGSSSGGGQGNGLDRKAATIPQGPGLTKAPGLPSGQSRQGRSDSVFPLPLRAACLPRYRNGGTTRFACVIYHQNDTGAYPVSAITWSNPPRVQGFP